MKISPLEGYRSWAETWDTDLSPIVALESRHLAPRLENLAGKFFVDVACGTGRWLVEAQARGARVLGTDFCAEMLARASTKQGLAGRLVLADSRYLPFRSACADVVLFALALGHVKPLEAAIAELDRLLRPGGSLIITDFHPDAAARGWKRTFRHGSQVYEIENHSYTKEQLIRASQAAGLELVELLEPHFDEPERSIFRRAGKEQLFEQVREIPAVLIGRWKRP